MIFILTDDLGWGDLGVFHQNDSSHAKTHRTPNLDQLALGGLQMRAHYCPAPVCAPSRSSLLTGVHQGNAVIRDNQFDKALEDNHALGTVMRAAGYRTCMIGKYGLQGGPKAKQQYGTPDDWPAYPTQRGFDEFFGYVSHFAGHLHYPNDPWEMANEGHRGLPNLWWSDDAGDREVSEQLSGCYTTDLFTAKSKHFITKHRSENPKQPFFLVLNYDTPHAALQVPTMAYPDGGGTQGGLQWTGQAGKMINTASVDVDSFIHPDYRTETLKPLEQRFATMVRRIDSAVGDLQHLLRDLNIEQETLVVFTSDNGPHHESYVAGDGWGDGRYKPTIFQSYGPYDGTKRDCWEGGIRMPTLASWPGTIAAGGIDSNPSQFHDWMATLCDVAGIAAPARCDGVTLLPTLLGNSDSQPIPTTYIEYFQNGKTQPYDDFLAARQGRRRRQMQVIRMLGDDGRSYKGVRVDIQSVDDDFEIYDVEADVDEANNLAADGAAFATLQAKMKARVLQIRHPNASAPRPYDDAPIPADMDPRGDIPVDGFSFGRVETQKPSPWVPQVNAKSLTGTSVINPSSQHAWEFSASSKPAQVHHAVGRIQIPETGRYELRLTTNTPAFVRLHDAHAIDADRGDGSSATRMLAAGQHTVRITFRTGEEPLEAKFQVIPEN
ncbi:MAG: sulfatase-like hydrolase/transferase [Planctomycetota bacterium]